MPLGATLAGGSSDFSGNALSATREALEGTGPFSTAGGFLGFLLGGPVGATIGATIGALIGGTLGYRKAVTDIRDHDRTIRRNSIERSLGPMRKMHRREAENGIDEAFRQFSVAVEQELNAQIRLERESLNAALESTAAARRRTADESARRIRELKQPVATLESVQGEIKTVAQRLGLAGGHKPVPT